ncbi:MAG: cell division protein FtsZ, partial [Actinomycetota bacterium]
MIGVGSGGGGVYAVYRLIVAGLIGVELIGIFPAAQAVLLSDAVVILVIGRIL